MQATARWVSVVSATSCARRRLIRDVRPTSTPIAMPAKKAAKKSAATAPLKKCGLCGKKTNLIRTECCGNWICDDEHKYVAFSYARNSCSRNHRKQTLCCAHYSEGHKGDWKTCQQCRDMISTTAEYVWYGTNEYNFDKLPNPPEFDPIRCSKCDCVITIGEDGYSVSGGKFSCERCSPFPL